MNLTLKNLIDSSKYQVFLMSCPAVPFIFARHHWFVVNQKGEISRWEVSYENGTKMHWGFLDRDILPPFSYGLIPYNHHLLKRGSVLDFVEGGEDSVAQRTAQFIFDSHKRYPYREKYSSLGPNSNTYVQWILDRCPDFKTKLPANAIGKSYARSATGSA